MEHLVLQLIFDLDSWILRLEHDMDVIDMDNLVLQLVFDMDSWILRLEHDMDNLVL